MLEQMAARGFSGVFKGGGGGALGLTVIFFG